MLIEPTLEKLRAMRLSPKAEAYREQQGKPDMGELGFEERFGLLVDAEQIARENKRRERLLREAKLKQTRACMEDIENAPRRGLDKPTLRRRRDDAFLSR